jgi:hypothetical protein
MAGNDVTVIPDTCCKSCADCSKMVCLREFIVHSSKEVFPVLFTVSIFAMKPVLITGIGGKVGGVSQMVLEHLLNKGIPVRAMFHSENEMSENLKLR